MSCGASDSTRGSGANQFIRTTLSHAEQCNKCCTGAIQASPDGVREDIINVPNYSFAWQPTYRLVEPILLPEGTRVLIEGAFDNSHHNLGNPDPNAIVRGGAQSWDEMFIGYFSYRRTGK